MIDIRSTKPQTNSAMRGFSLLEITIVLGIIGMISGAVYLAYGNLRTANRVRIAEQELTAIAGNMRSIYSEAGGITGVEAPVTTAADRMHVFPVEMRSSTVGMLYNPWSSLNNTLAAGGGTVGSVSVASGGDGHSPGCDEVINSVATAPAMPCFAVVFLGVPPAACMRLVFETSQAQFSSNLLGITVNSHYAYDPSSPTYGGNLPYTLAVAGSVCTLASNSVVWFYNLK